MFTMCFNCSLMKDTFVIQLYDHNGVVVVNTGSTLAFKVCQYVPNESCCETEGYSWIPNLPSQGFDNGHSKRGNSIDK